MDEEKTAPVRVSKTGVVVESVGRLSHEVSQLNEGLAEKNRIDKFRNRMIVVTSVIGLVLALVVLSILKEVKDESAREAQRNEERQREAVETRRLNADCQQPPGRVLIDGYVNPGICWQEREDRVASYLQTIQNDVRTALAEQGDLIAANANLLEEVRRRAMEQAEIARSQRSSTTTTTRTSSRTRATPTTTTTRPTSPPTSLPPKPPPESTCILPFLCI